MKDRTLISSEIRILKEYDDKKSKQKIKLLQKELRRMKK